MNVYAVIATRPETVAGIGQALTEKFPEHFIQAGDRLWFVSDKGTTFEFSSKLGVMGRGGGGLITSVVILPVTTYWGHENTALWEWLKNRLEATV